VALIHASDRGTGHSFVVLVRLHIVIAISGQYGTIYMQVLEK
jgi:hypothetical protein